MRKIYFLLLFVLISASTCFSQIENVQLSSPVYDFIKEMSVKKIIAFDDDNPNLSRFEVADFLKTIATKTSQLSNTEIKLLNKYKVEYIPEESNSDNTWQMFGSGKKFSKNLDDFFSNKQKYLYKVGKPGNNAYVEGLGNLNFGYQIKPNSDKMIYTFMMDGGFRARGTVFNHLGYSVDLSKGALFGDNNLAPYIEPRLRTDFKFNENAEVLKNYDFSVAYLKYYVEPLDGFHLSAEFGREKITFGYGYGSKPMLSGNSPDMDFLKLNLKYGIVRYTSIFASTVGYFSSVRDDRYTKYFSAQRLKIAIPDMFDVAISDLVIYNGRIELAYMNPILFYTFAEKSLQDRDNKAFEFDLKTTAWKNAEFTGSVFIDDDEQFAFVTGKTSRSEKFVYQVGTMLYEPLNLRNLSFTVEYTKVRPYTYSHYNVKDNYTAYGENMGHRIGPNADEIFTRLTYNISDWGRINLEYSHVRKGNNIYDANGNLVRNVGGDILYNFRDGIDDPNAQFLDGERVNTEIVGLTFRWIPIRNYIFDFHYDYNLQNFVTQGYKSDFSYAYLKLNINY
ncbi:MAG: capsule assembly Wzi family protein [Ignavibacteriota bacterium]